MKITMYELLGMVKDGKAPKTVKSEGHYYTYNELEKDYYEGMGYDYEYLLKNTSIDRLNVEVEILDDEEKKIPDKILEDEFDELTKEGKLWKLFYKYNKLIDYLEKQRKGE